MKKKERNEGFKLKVGILTYFFRILFSFIVCVGVEIGWECNDWDGAK